MNTKLKISLEVLTANIRAVLSGLFLAWTGLLILILSLLAAPVLLKILSEGLSAWLPQTVVGTGLIWFIYFVHRGRMISDKPMKELFDLLARKKGGKDK